MQANQDPNWTDDAAFWDEAWEDMSRRLEAEPDRKKAIVPWWRRFGVLASLLLPTVAVALPVAYPGVFQNTETPEAPPATSPQEEAPESKAPPVVAQLDANKQATNAAPRPTPPLEEPKAQSEQVPLAASVSPSAKEVTEPVAKASVAANEMVQIGQTKKESVLAIERPAASPAPPSHSTLTPTPEFTNAAVIPQPTISIAALDLLPLPVSTSLATPEVSTLKLRRKPSLFLDAGVSSAFRGMPIGNYLGLGVDISISPKLSVPVSVRYRQDYLAPRSFPTRNNNDLVEAMVPVTGVDPMADQDTVLFDFSAGDLDRIETRGLEASLGLAYNLSPRFSIQTGLAAKYLFSATSMITQEVQAEYLATNEQVLLEDLGFLNNGSSTRAISNSLAITGENEQPQFNRVMLRAELGLNYRLNNRLSLTASGRSLLLQPDKTQTLGVRRGQANLGLRWRLR